MTTGEPFLLWGLIGGVLLLIAYLILVSTARKRKPDLVVAIGSIASCIGISGAAKVGWNTILAALHGLPITLAAEDRHYAIFGCIALIWISAPTIIRAVKK